MKRTLGLFFTALLAGSCASMAPSGGSLAEVDGEPITAADLKAEFGRRHSGHDRFLAGASEIRSFLDVLIDSRLLVREAYELRLDESTSVTQATEEFRRRKIVDHLIRREINDRSQVSAAEVREAWETRTTVLYDLRHIVVASREDAESIRTSLINGADFDRLARQCSVAGSRMYSGRLSQLGWGTMEPTWEEVVFKLEPGDISPVIDTEAGWQVVQLLSTTEVPRPDPGRATEKIRGILEKRKLESRKKQFAEELWSRFHARITVAEISPRLIARLSSDQPDTPVAAWDGGTFTVHELAAGTSLPFLAMLPALKGKQQLETEIRTAVNEKLLAQLGVEEHVAEVPEIAEAVRRYQESLMEMALFEQHIMKDIEIPDDEIRAYFDQHRDELVEPETRRVAHVLVNSAEEAAEVRRKLIEGEDFQTMARSRSTDVQTAQIGGDLGWIGQKETPPEFAPVLTLGEGELSEPIKSGFGWHLIQVVKIAPRRSLELGEASPRIRDILMKQKQTNRREFWLRKLRSAAEIRIHDDAIRAFVRENSIEQ